VILAYANAAYRLSKEGKTGVRMVIDIAPAYLSPKTGEEIGSMLIWV
jgi:diaminopimelate dehydrogenase